jgi:hypothetical protein
MLVVLVACGDSSTKDSPVEAARKLGVPARIREGTKIRLNLATPEARAQVLYKDPVQGVRGANGKCQFPDVGQNSGKMRVGLMATVGEWDTETCAALLYYFKPSTRPHPKPSQEDTAVPPPTAHS